jgi:hypothetical protein
LGHLTGSRKKDYLSISNKTLSIYAKIAVHLEFFRFVVAFLVPFVCALPTFPNFLLNYGE